MSERQREYTPRFAGFQDRAGRRIPVTAPIRTEEGPGG